MATKKTEDAKKVVAKKATVESVVAKAEAVKKAEAAKEVKAAVKAEPVKAEVKEEKKPAAKKPAAKKPAAKTTETVFVEYNNGQINVSDIVAKAKEALGNKAVKELNVYYQPETGMFVNYQKVQKCACLAIT